ncbi:MAG: PadR family transcriptional regulator [Peptococcaceae bacterium]|nr:PadR family transcriptional regulator [Peptococcaceae bacterium]
MRFAVSGTLLDSCVLGVLQSRPTYGYELTQKIQAAIDVSESTLYPVLRRLLQCGMLDTYDEPFDGRNRRYYRITGEGKAALEDAVTVWQGYKERIETLLTGGIEL